MNNDTFAALVDACEAARAALQAIPGHERLKADALARIDRALRLARAAATAPEGSAWITSARPCPRCHQQGQVVYRDTGNDHGDEAFACRGCGHGWYVEGSDA